MFKKKFALNSRAPTPMHKGGRMRVPIFSGKGVGGRFPEKNRKSFFFVIVNGNQKPEIGGYILGYPFPE